MKKYNLHVIRTDTLNRVKECMRVHIDNDKWLRVEVLGNLFGADLSSVFGNGDLGWSPSALLNRCSVNEMPHVDVAVVSMPEPEEIPDGRSGPTVRDLIEEAASRERPTLKDWLNNSGIHNGAITDPFEKSCMRDALAILRRMNEDRRTVHPELIEQLIEMRTLIHTLIGTGENCCDETTYEYAESLHKSTRLDWMDAFAYAIRALLERKDAPGVKSALNSIYGIAAYEGDRIDNALKSIRKAYEQAFTDVLNGNSEDNTADESNALFVTIETGTFDATLENVEAVRAFILDAGQGRDIHLKIV